jgi:hypothetical protein
MRNLAQQLNGLRISKYSLGRVEHAIILYRVIAMDARVKSIAFFNSAVTMLCWIIPHIVCQDGKDNADTFP